MVERKLESYLSFLRSSKDTVTKNGLIQHLMPALDFVLPQSHETTTDIKFPRQYRSKKYDPGQNAIFPKVKNKKIQRVQAKHTDSLINQLILECKTSTVDSKCWLYILAAEPLDVFHHITVFLSFMKMKNPIFLKIWNKLEFYGLVLNVGSLILKLLIALIMPAKVVKTGTMIFVPLIIHLVCHFYVSYVKILQLNQIYP